MIATIGNIPVYNALITDADTGMMKISLVDDPAVMSNFLAFDASRKPLMYSVQDEDKRLVQGIVMRADFPIYRIDSRLGEYYIIYKAEEIRKMAEKYLAEGRCNLVNLMHEEGSDVDSVNMVQFFIKDTERGICPKGFEGEEIADGSLFAEFHIVDEDLWQKVKDGTFKGFSLEGVFDLVPETNEDEVSDIVSLLDGAFRKLFPKHKNMSKLSRLKSALAKILAEFGNITTDKGVLVWDGDEDIKVGDSVSLELEDGNTATAEDGDYLTAEGVTIVVADGKVAEIREAVAAPAEPEEMANISTDKGVLSWNGEEDLKEGDEVFVESEGERVPAPDGDYTTEDGKVIAVADGKVASIKDPKAEVSPTETELRRQSFLKKMKEAYEDSYEEKERKILEAVIATLPEGSWAYLCEAGDNYVVASIVDAEWNESLVKYEVSWDESGNAVLGASEEVKPAFVPVDEPNPADPAPSAEEVSALKAENASLKAEVERLKKTPLAKPAHEEAKEPVKMGKTGLRELDNLARFLSAK